MRLARTAGVALVVLALGAPPLEAAARSSAAPKPCRKTGTLRTAKGKLLRNSSKANPGKRFKDRADQRDEDQERRLGATANLSGFTMTVTAGEFVQSLSTIENSGYLKIAVKICNRNDDAQPINPVLDWSLLTPAGVQIDPAFVSVPALGPGTLVKGGESVGDLYFDVGAQRGDFYAIFKPFAEAFEESRGVWKVTI